MFVYFLCEDSMLPSEWGACKSPASQYDHEVQLILSPGLARPQQATEHTKCLLTTGWYENTWY